MTKLPAPIAVAFFLALLSLTPALAQVDRGVIELVALDPGGQALPGVTVTARRAEVGLELVSVTAENGLARFPALAPGTYQVQAELSGFAPFTQSDLALRVGQTRRVEVILRPQASETITVTAASNVVDIYKTDSSTNIVPEQIESLPVADRDFQRLAFIAPGVERERGAFRFIGGGPVLGAGGNASHATIMVDGVNFTDQALGLARARFSQDAIREFRVITNRFDTEIGGSYGGALSVVTKSGTNDLSGTIFAFYRDDELREPGALALDELPYQRSQFGFTLGGPMVRDRTHYFLSLEQIDEDNVTLFRPGGAFASQAADIEHPFEQLLGFAGLDHQINDRQNLAVKFVYEDYSEENFRVGGIADVSYGQKLLRDNWNLTGGHNWTVTNTQINEVRMQAGSRKYFEPTNSDVVAEWFSSGTTLQTGANILGDLLGEGDHWEIRDTYHFSIGSLHNLKAGLSLHHIDERSVIDVFQNGLFLYITDTRALPLAYLYGVGSSDVSTDTTLYGAFIEDQWRPRSNLTVSLGLRYDLDTKGNNPDFEHPLVPNGRDVDTDNFQPRVGFSWDTTGQGQYVLRGGAGIFTGRYLLVPAFVELQQNGITGRVAFTRLNGALIGLPALTLDVNNPTTTGVRLPPDIGLMDVELKAPESTQATLGLTTRLGSTGLYFDVEAIYAEGDNEIIIRDENFGGNSNPRRLNPAYNQVNVYTNEGHSEYQAVVLGLNGVIRGGHIVTTNVTFADKKNINDDFSPEFPFGYPNDPSNIEAEYGPSRSGEDFRAVLSAVFRLPWNLTLASIYEYGSGQPWTHRRGYDFNGDGKNSDRPAGVGRYEEDGPEFTQFSLRLAKSFPFSDLGSLHLIVEAFNLFDQTNFDVNSIDAAEFFSGPTLANPNAVARPNPNFGNYRATLPGREIQLGVRWAF